MPIAGAACISGDKSHIVAATTFERFVEANELDAPLRLLIEAVQREQTSAIDDLAATIRVAIARGTFPLDVAVQLSGIYDTTAAPACPRISVRSTATAHDANADGFSCMFDTVLNIVSAEALRRAVKTCWVASFMPDAIRSRVARGDAVGLPAELVVERMVEATRPRGLSVVRA